MTELGRLLIGKKPTDCSCGCDGSVRLLRYEKAYGHVLEHIIVVPSRPMTGKAHISGILQVCVLLVTRTDNPQGNHSRYASLASSPSDLVTTLHAGQGIATHCFAIK